MDQYINKTTVVAEIERILSIHTKRYNELAKYEVWITAKEIEYRIQGLKEALSIIDTLEVKEVDLQSEIDRVWDNTSDNFSEDGWKEFEDIAKHFFELGLKAQKL